MAHLTAGATAIPPGPGRLFTLVYGVFAVGATARSAVQLLTRAAHAPLAYTLSALAAVVYVVGLALLLRWGKASASAEPSDVVRRQRTALRRLATVELTGVALVGALSLARPDLFPDATVWSRFGMGYLFLPIIVPVLLLRWLRRTS